MRYTECCCVRCLFVELRAAEVDATSSEVFLVFIYLKLFEHVCKKTSDRGKIANRLTRESNTPRPNGTTA